jgi:hypothetical protein
MTSMPIDLTSVDWAYVLILAGFAFLASLIGGVLAFGRHLLGALLSAILFAAAFVFWTYYPHHFPLPTALAPPKPAVTTAPAPVAPAVPARPRNPVTDITPPATPPAPPPAAPPAPATPPAAPPAR